LRLLPGARNDHFLFKRLLPMIKNILLTTALFASIGAAAQTASYQDRARQYIQQFKEFAQEEQRRSGVPAAITLGQGILETDAGRSELATEANNHFGIKCKKSWTGETFAHDDDAPQECFRKYPSALHSYKDHSDYLKASKRYESCFAQDPTDYVSWAKELRKCGYATNPRYAQALIKIIEDFKLQDYTYAAMTPKAGPVLVASAASPVAAAMMAEEKAAAEVVPEHDTPSNGDEKPEYGKVIRRDGARGFYARKGDVLLEYAIQHRVRYAKLLEINDLPDAPLAKDMFIWLEKGGKITRIISRDVAAAPAIAYEAEAPAKNEGIRRQEPVLAGSAPAGTGQPVAANRPSAEPPAPKTRQDNLLSAAGQAAPPVAAAAPASTGAAKPTAAPVVASQPAPKPAAAPEKPVNIADEVAVEEEVKENNAEIAKEAGAEVAKEDSDEEEDEVKEDVKPKAAEEPQDEFSRLKARLDKVVYAPSKPRAQRPAAPAAATPAVSEKPVAPAPAPAAASTGSSKTYHTVKSGETAFGIARQYGISMKELMTMNDLNFEAIKVGQKLRVK
jgi:LysM repeat protein